MMIGEKMKDDMEVCISVIIPAYNSGTTIARCLKSVCEQNLKNIEIIVVDDGSTDATSQIVSKFALLDDRIKYIKKNNGGVSSARNCALDVAKGEYIAFLDSDDYVLPDIYSTMLQYMDQDTDLLISGYKTMSNGFIVDICPSKQAVESIDWRDRFGETFTQFLWNTPWNKLFKRKKVLHKFDTKKHLGEDLKFVLDYVTAGSKVIYCPEALYVNDKSNENSLSKNWNNWLNEEWENDLLIGTFIERHGIPYTPELSDYFLSTLWVTAGKAAVFHCDRSKVFQFVTLTDKMKNQILHYNPKKLVNKITLSVLKRNCVILNYIVLTLFGMLSEYKNRK